MIVGKCNYFLFLTFVQTQRMTPIYKLYILGDNNLLIKFTNYIKCTMFIKRKAVHWWEQETDEKFLHTPLKFSTNLKCFKSCISDPWDGSAGVRACCLTIEFNCWNPHGRWKEGSGSCKLSSDLYTCTAACTQINK